MAKKGFNLAELAKAAMGEGAAVSELDTVRAIPVGKITPNGANFYEMSDLEELAASIELTGLLHPILVKPSGEGGYIILDGERRFRAATEVLAWAEIPALVRVPVNDVLEELMLIEANRTARKLSAADLSKQAERYTELLAGLKVSGVPIPGRLRDRVAEALQVSASKLARLSAIRKNLEPGLLALFDDGDLNESAAYELSKFDPVKQVRIRDALALGNLEFSVENVRQAAAGDDLMHPTDEPKQTVETPEARPNEPEEKPVTKTYGRRTSILSAARVLGLDFSQPENNLLERLKEEIRTRASACGPDYNVDCAHGRVYLDHYTTAEHHYTPKEFIRLGKEIQREMELRLSAPKMDTVPGLEWHDADAGDLPDSDIPRDRIVCFGLSGLMIPRGFSYERAYRVMPEVYRWWAAVEPPKEVHNGE